MARNRAVLTVLALTAASCGVLPDDHLVPDTLGRSLRRTVDAVGDLGGVVDGAGRDLSQLTVKIADLPDATAQQFGDARRAGEQLVDRSTFRVQRFFPEVQDTLGAAFDDGARELAALPDAPARIGIDVEQDLGGLKRSLAGSGATLGLDRTPWANPDDPEHSVEVVPTARDRSWLERILDRMAF